MNVQWQDLATLAIVCGAALYLTRAVWLTFSEHGGCGSCGSCATTHKAEGADKAKGGVQIVELQLDATTDQRSTSAGTPARRGLSDPSEN